jgi:hypothetical protein
VERLIADGIDSVHYDAAFYALPTFDGFDHLSEALVGLRRSFSGRGQLFWAGRCLHLHVCFSARVKGRARDVLLREGCACFR